MSSAVTAQAAATTARAPARERIPELDWLKGLAVLFVVCIHAQPFSESFVFTNVVNRAVSIFVLLFGLSSELWWQRAREHQSTNITRRWLESRLLRLLPAYWALLAVWWPFVFYYRHHYRYEISPFGWPQMVLMDLDGRHILASALGYMPWIGTSWFVTVILQYVLLFPLLRRAVERFGLVTSVLVSLVITTVSAAYMFEIVRAGLDLFGQAPGGTSPDGGWYFHWIFAPRVLFHVIVGIAIARKWRGVVTIRATLLAFALTALGWAAFDHLQLPDEADDFLAKERKLTLIHILDIPLTIGLLGALRKLWLPDLVQRALGFCGKHSWGIYLSQLLVHDLLQLTERILFEGTNVARMVYALLLLALGVIISVCTSWAFERAKQRFMPA